MSPIITRSSVLITGGAGFIGANLVNKLLDFKYNNVNLIVRESTVLWRLKTALPKIHLHKVDLLDMDNLKKTIEKVNPSIIFHLATYSAYRNQEAALEMIETNIKGTLNLLISSQDINYDIFVNTGSSSEYGIKEKPMKEDDLLKPVSFYAATKSSATLLCQAFSKEYKKPIVTLRPFSVYGPYEENDRFIPTIIKAIIENKPISLTPGRERRDFIYIADIIDIYIKTIKKGNKLSGEILNMGTGKEFTNDEVVDMLFKVANKKVQINKGSFPARLWDNSHWVSDISKTKKLLNWKPQNTLLDGLKKTYDWYKYA